MDASELVPGLCKMLEERMGPTWGRFTTNMVLAAVVLAIFVWCFGVVKREMLDPLWNIIEKGYGWDTAFFAGRMMVYLFVMFIGCWVGVKWIERTTKRRTDQTNRVLTQKIEEIVQAQEKVQALNRDTHKALEAMESHRGEIKALATKTEKMIPLLKDDLASDS